MGLLDKIFGTDLPAGIYHMDVLYGFWDGFTMPAGMECFISLAPEEYPGSVVGFREFSGPEIGQHVWASDVEGVEAVSGGATFFGSGLDGAVAAGLASAIDARLAPWELRVFGPPGEFHLRAWGGLGSPLPGRHTWARVEERLAAARFSAHSAQSLATDPNADLDDELAWRELLTDFIYAALPLAPVFDDEERQHRLLADPFCHTGLERVETDIRLEEGFGGEELTNDEYDCLAVTLALFVKAPLEAFPPRDIDSAEAYYSTLSAELVAHYGEDIFLGLVEALNQAFVDYALVLDTVACAAVAVMARYLAQEID